VHVLFFLARRKAVHVLFFLLATFARDVTQTVGRQCMSCSFSLRPCDYPPIRPVFATFARDVTQTVGRQCMSCSFFLCLEGSACPVLSSSVWKAVHVLFFLCLSPVWKAVHVLFFLPVLSLLSQEFIPIPML
jgi:hypothetical protein